MARKSAADKLLGEWFWTDRWMGSSAFLLPMEPRGLYREMLTQAWMRGARLPADHETIQRAVGCTAAEWKRCWPRIERYWRVEGDSLVNDTQLVVYAECQAERERASNRGKKGAQARAQAVAQARAQATTQAATQDSTHVPPEVLLKHKPPDPDPEELSKEQESSRRGRARAFTGQRLKVSEAQHQVVIDQHGDHVDWVALYQVWDEQLVASQEPFDTLVFIKQRAAEQVRVMRAVGASHRVDPDEEARRAARAAEHERRQQELTDAIDDLWLLAGETVRQQLRADAVSELKPFQSRMTKEAHDRALEAAAKRLLAERFPTPDARQAELDRLRQAVAS